jgi:hypothetical protein
MKHLKLFETYHKVGDYVLLKIDDKTQYHLNFIHKYGKIIYIDNDRIPYKVLFSTGEWEWTTVGMIERKLTPEEIKQYELESNINKFNI